MARTIKEWYNIVAAEKNTFSTLSDYTVINDAQTMLDQLTTTSKVRTTSLWIWIWAFSAWVFGNFLELFKVDVQAIVDSKKPPTPQWVKSKVLEFQFDLGAGTGFNIVRVNGVPQYATIDTTKRPIARCSVVETTAPPQLVKVAIDQGGGVLGPAGSTLLNALVDYFQEIKPFGLKVQFISLNADKMRYDMDFYYDPYKATSATVLTQIEEAIEAYHEELEFNGSIDLNKLEDKLQAIDAHVRHRISGASGDSGGTVISFTSSYQTVAGWAVLHDTAPNRLQDTVNLIAV